MHVVEITQLRLRGVTANDPALLESLSQVRRKLQTDSHFFSCIDESSLIYIFGIWPSLDAHLAFLASPARDEVLSPQEAILNFQWTIHLELDAITPQLFDSPFLAIERFDVDAAKVEAYDQIVADHLRKLRCNDRGLIGVTYAWRCDMPTRSHEAAILTTWSSDGDGSTKAGRRITLEHDDDESFRRILFHRAWNIEHAQSAS
ncbi:hypothetical protein E8E12_006313 [Didymella heteroderae]|uniref:ABM domain-containing protein n=1 Tax=Didymella heteroderae TaxID=1769908 RepID=A0A9P4WQS1_9PLEO|nr:hypothetical protein E8E12_006313 [Didymella heteroderae]